MDRRDFGKNLAIGLSGPFLGFTGKASPSKQKIKPNRLGKGDLIGLITPGSYVDDKGLQKAVVNLESLGFRVKLSNNIRKERGYNAGTDEQRLSDLHSMFTDKNVAAIWCARGGYGCTRLLPYIDYNLIARNPKVLIGYSDVTALLQAINLKTNLVGFHGPVAASSWSDYTIENVKKVLIEPSNFFQIPLSKKNESHSNTFFKTKVIRPGNARGELVGGNLSLLAAMAGTDYGINLEGKIIFMEDVEEKPYRIDRMLTQLRQAANLEKAAGIVLGVFVDCQPEKDDRSLTLMQTFEDRLGDLEIPVLYGFPFGHIRNQCTFPVGIDVKLDASSKQLTLLEAGVK